MDTDEGTSSCLLDCDLRKIIADGWGLRKTGTFGAIRGGLRAAVDCDRPMWWRWWWWRIKLENLVNKTRKKNCNNYYVCNVFYIYLKYFISQLNTLWLIYKDFFLEIIFVIYSIQTGFDIIYQITFCTRKETQRIVIK